MPYCDICGSLIDVGSRFCSKCGNSVEGNSQIQNYDSVSAISQQGDIRKASIIEINKMISYFGQKQAQFDEYDECIEKIAYYSGPRPQIQVSVSPGTALKVPGIIMTILGSLFLFFSLEFLFSRAASLGVGLLVSGLILLPLGIFLLSIGNKKNHLFIQEYNEKKASFLKQYEDRRDALAEELNNHYMNYGYCPVAASYTNPQILTLIREPIDLGRADTIKEAINVMIQDSHNSEMELQAQMAAQAAASAARSSKATAFFTAGTFINTLRR